jgi:hypothetical protein
VEEDGRADLQQRIGNGKDPPEGDFHSCDAERVGSAGESATGRVRRLAGVQHALVSACLSLNLHRLPHIGPSAEYDPASPETPAMLARRTGKSRPKRSLRAR